MFTIFLIGFVTVLLYFYYKNKLSYWKRKGIKGPKAYPILGTLLEEIKLPSKETEEKFLKEFGPVFGTYFNTCPVFNTSRVEDIKTVLSDLKTFPNDASIQFNDKYLQNSILFKNGLDWKTGRSAQTYYFTSKKFRNLLPHFEKVTSNFLENLANIIKETKSNDIEVKQLSKYYGTDCISKVLFAIDVDSYKERDTTFVKSATSLGEINLIQSTLCTILPKKLCEFLKLKPFNLNPINQLGDYFKKIIEDRKKHGIKYNDLTEVLQDAINNDKVKMNETEVIGNILLAFLAGVEPVSNAVSQMMYLLSKHPNIQTKLRNEIAKEFSDEISYEKLTQNEYLDAVVNESMRLGNNITFQSRIASMDTELGEHLIEKGTEIRLISYIQHMSSDHYMDPRTFNPDRFLKGSNEIKNEDRLFIPFGAGHKMCLGQRLALLEIKYLFARLLPKYELIEPTVSGYKSSYIRGFYHVNSMNVGFKKLV